MGDPRIVSTATAVPAHSATQERGEGAAARGVRPADARRLDAAMELFDHAAVERRYSVEPIAAARARAHAGRDPGALPRARARARREVAARALARRRRRAPRRSISIITVSCTGIMIPSLDAHLVDELGLPARRAAAADHGARAARAARRRWRARTTSCVGFPDARALVVAVELPSLSLQRADLSPANLVVDGAVRRRRGGGRARPGGETARRPTGVRVLETLSHIFPRIDRTRWASTCRTTASTPCCRRTCRRCSRREIAALVERAARRGAGLARERAVVCFVLHPGGRKILGVVEEELGLSRERHAAVVGRAARLRQPVERVGAVRAARVADASGRPRRARTACWRRSAPG